VHLRHGRAQRRRKGVVVVSVTTSSRRQVALQPVEALGEEGCQVIDLVAQVGGHLYAGAVCRRRTGGLVVLRLVSQG
jgi:hypothetical protein